jgi:hypothetical protein
MKKYQLILAGVGLMASIIAVKPLAFILSLGTGPIGPGIMSPTMGITPPTPPAWLLSIMKVLADGIAR